MIRTQVYIPDDLYRDLLVLSKYGNTSFSGLIREGVEEIIKKRKNTNSAKINRFVGACTSGLNTNAKDAIEDYYTNDVI